MAKFSINGVEKLLKDIDSYGLYTKDLLIDELNRWAIDVVRLAKTKAPVNNGKLRGAINADYATKTSMKASVSVDVVYAAYVEFGTRGYAGSYVSSLPNDWQTYASSFKGKSGSGTMDDFLNAIIDWVKDKGLAGTYSVKTQRRTGAKDARELQDIEVAYPIALAILRKGIKPQPYLFPAVVEANESLKQRLQKYEKS
jgi:hypothetical protein